MNFVKEFLIKLFLVKQNFGLKKLPTIFFINHVEIYIENNRQLQLLIFINKHINILQSNHSKYYFDSSSYFPSPTIVVCGNSELAAAKPVAAAKPNTTGVRIFPAVGPL